MKDSAFESFSEGYLEAAREAWEFKQCQRKDGTIYGVPDSSSCEKGKEVKASQGSGPFTGMRAIMAQDPEKLDRDLLSKLGTEGLKKIEKATYDQMKATPDLDRKQQLAKITMLAANRRREIEKGERTPKPEPKPKGKRVINVTRNASQSEMLAEWRNIYKYQREERGETKKEARRNATFQLLNEGYDIRKLHRTEDNPNGVFKDMGVDMSRLEFK